MAEWHENDEFWGFFRTILFRRERIENAKGEIDGVVRLLDAKAGASILDLCCGVGRHSLELARRGYSVTAVDRTAAYLERARQDAEKESLAIEFVQSDMRDFLRPDAFDGAINLFTSFGYFEDPAEDLKVAQNLYRSLRLGARLVIDVLGKEVLARRFRERDWEPGPDGSLFLTEHRLRSGWDWIDVRWIVIRGTERREFTFAHRLYAGSELAILLRQAGFANVSLYGSLAATPYDHNAERLVAVAQK